MVFWVYIELWLVPELVRLQKKYYHFGDRHSHPGKISIRRWYSSRQRGSWGHPSRIKNGWTAVMEAQNVYMHTVATGNDHLHHEDNV